MSNRVSPAIAIEDGSLVPQHVIQVIQAIREYNEELDVEWVPPRARKPGIAAFKIVHRPIGGEPYTIFHVQNEDEFDSRVLMRIIHGDASVNGQPKYSQLEAAEEAARRVAHQAFLDSLQEQEEMARALLKTDKSVYKFNKDLIFHEDRIGNVAKDYRPRIIT